MMRAALAAVMLLAGAAATGAQPDAPGAFRHQRTVTVTTPKGNRSTSFIPVID